MTTMTIPDELMQKFRDQGWTNDDVIHMMMEEMLKRGLTLRHVDTVLSMGGGLTPERSAQFANQFAGQMPGYEGRPVPVSTEQQEYVDKLQAGKYDLSWLKDKSPSWGVRATPKDAERGLTLLDINAAYAGEPSDTAPYNHMGARGGVLESEPAVPYPDMDYLYNDKYQVWADNIVPLYEEAVTRQWSATKDIPWDELKPLPDDLERAQCEISTLLTEVEMIASDFPAKWLWRMNQHFHEVKMFLCTQAMDEARHLEVFRKRALANGGGLMHCRADTEVFLSNVLLAPTYVHGSFLMHILGEGLVLDIFRAGEFLAKNKTEQEMYRLCMQDEARHVSYGTMHLKYYLDHHPDRENAVEELHALADLTEQGILGFCMTPYIVEPLAVLAGNGVKHIDKGMDAVRVVYKCMREEYLNRCRVAGFDRLSRTSLPEEVPY